MRRRLRPYQVDAVDKLAANNGGLLLMEMRLGKTLCVMRYLQRFGNVRHLIVSPFPAFATWIDDSEQEGYSLAVIDGSAAKRKALVAAAFAVELDRPQFVLVNKEIMFTIPELWKYPFHSVTLDEAHFIKSPKSQVQKFFNGGSVVKYHIVNGMRKVKSKKVFPGFDTPVKIGLTGTPRTNDDLDYVTLLKFVNPKVFGGIDYWRFRAVYTRPFGFNHVLTPAGRSLLSSAIAENAFVLTRADVGLDKVKIFERRLCKMTSEQRRIYNRVLDEFLLEIGPDIKETKYAVEKYLWLRRLCGGYIDGALCYREKYQLLQDVFQELPGEAVVVFCHFVEEALEVARQVSPDNPESVLIHGDTKKETRRDIMRKFQAGKLPRIVCTPDCVKVGTDLSRASTAIYFSQPTSFEAWKQSQDRILSVRKDGPLLYIMLHYDDSIDNEIYRSVNKKEDRAQFWNRLYREKQCRI